MKKKELKKDKNIKLELFQSIKAHNLHIYIIWQNMGWNFKFNSKYRKSTC